MLNRKIMSKKKISTVCPCGSGRLYAECCQVAHEGIPVKTAEALMRSRYSAFVFGLSDYLLSSWHSSTRPTKETLRIDENTHWLGLKVLSTHQGKVGDDVGTVEFVARYKVNGKATRIEELSEFIFEDGQWFYVAAKA